VASLYAFGEFTVNLNRRSAICGQAQRERAFDLAVQQLQQDTVIQIIQYLQ